MSGTLGVVLAAGSGSRFDGPEPKLLAEFRGRPLVAWAVAAARGAISDVVVVAGAVDLSAALIDDGERGVEIVANPHASGGVASSLQVARRLADDRGHEAMVVGLGDQPLVPSAAWSAVAAERSTPIVVATFDGHRAPPTRLARSVWPLLPETGDEGARRLMGDRPELVTELPCPGRAADIDTLEDLRRWS